MLCSRASRASPGDRKPTATSLAAELNLIRSRKAQHSTAGSIAMEPRRTTFTPRFAITLLFVAVVSYFWGGFTVYKQIFPYRQIQNLKNKYVGDSLTSSPRYTMFQTFSPTSDVVMVGDSLTADAPWNEIFPKVQIANRGIGGDTTDNILVKAPTCWKLAAEMSCLIGRSRSRSRRPVLFSRRRADAARIR